MSLWANQSPWGILGDSVEHTEGFSFPRYVKPQLALAEGCFQRHLLSVFSGFLVCK